MTHRRRWRNTMNELLRSAPRDAEGGQPTPPQAEDTGRLRPSVVHAFDPAAGRDVTVGFVAADERTALASANLQVLRLTREVATLRALLRADTRRCQQCGAPLGAHSPASVHPSEAWTTALCPVFGPPGGQWTPSAPGAVGCWECDSSASLYPTQPLRFCALHYVPEPRMAELGGVRGIKITED